MEPAQNEECRGAQSPSGRARERRAGEATHTTVAEALLATASPRTPRGGTEAGGGGEGSPRA